MLTLGLVVHNKLHYTHYTHAFKMFISRRKVACKQRHCNKLYVLYGIRKINSKKLELILCISLSMAIEWVYIKEKHTKNISSSVVASLFFRNESKFNENWSQTEQKYISLFHPSNIILLQIESFIYR